MEKPDVDFIEGLSPAVAIEQRSAGANPRSTIATTTEIYDYLRAFFSAVSQPHDPFTGRSLSRPVARPLFYRSGRSGPKRRHSSDDCLSPEIARLSSSVPMTLSAFEYSTAPQSLDSSSFFLWSRLLWRSG
jgi:hypothetical protein